MDILYQPVQCDLCGLHPRLGWLYLCQEDTVASDPLPEDISAQSNDLVEELKGLGFNDTLIGLAKSGHYSIQELDILKLQRRNAIMSIKACMNNRPQKQTVENSQEPSSTHPNVTIRKKPKPGPGRKIIPSRKQKLPEPACPQPRRSAACTLKACHNCRPYYRDRVYTSLNAILSSPNPPNPTKSLPVIDATVVRQLGLRRTSQSTAPLPEGAFPSDMSSHSQGSQSSTTSSNHRDRSLGALQEVHPREIQPTPWITSPFGSQFGLKEAKELAGLPPPPPPSPRSPSVSSKSSSVKGSLWGLDHRIKGLFHKTLNRRASMDAIAEGKVAGEAGNKSQEGENSSKTEPSSLTNKRTHSSPTLTPIGGSVLVTCADSMLHGSNAAGRDRPLNGVTGHGSSGFALKDESDSGSEIEVEGGVALSEEAVEERVPDLIMQV